MRLLLLTAGVVCTVTGFTSRAVAQTADMPGQTVSSTAGAHLRLIGRDQPQVGQHVGKPINLPSSSPYMRPYDVTNPFAQLQGTNLNANSVVAPVNGFASDVQPGTFSQVINSIKSFVGLSTKPTLMNIYTPGIYRRDRQRVEARMWIRD
jgi:hypothetical protein